MASENNMPVTRGPDKWRLAESLFHDSGDFPDETTRLTFTVEYEGREHRLHLTVASIAREQWSDPDLYRIKGTGTIRTTGKDPETRLEHVPVQANYSTKSRTGMANISY